VTPRGKRWACLAAGIAAVVAFLVAALDSSDVRDATDASRDGGPTSAPHDENPVAGAARPAARARSRPGDTEAPAPAAARRIAGRVVIRAAADQPWRHAPDAAIPDGSEVVVLPAAAPAGAQGVALDPATDVVARGALTADGSFFVEPPGLGAWDVEARAPGAIGARVSAEAGAEGVELTLDFATEQIRVRFRARPLGEPVAGARVVSGCRGEESGPSGLRAFVPRTAAVSDARGEVQIGRGPGEVLVIAAPGFATQVEDSVRDGADIWLTPGDRIGGTVVDAAGAPVAGAEVHVAGTDGRGPWRTAADGTFTVEGVAADDGEVTVRAEAGTWSGELSGGTTDAVVVLRPAPAAVRGVVLLPDGTPAARADVNGVGTTSSDGRFAIVPRETGRLRLFATWRAPGVGGSQAEALQGEASVEVPATGAAEETTIRLRESPRSWVVVRVVDADGRAVPRARVSARAGATRDLRDDATVLLVPLPPGTETRVAFDEPGRPRVEQLVRTVGTPDATPTELRVAALATVRADVEFEGGAGPPVHPAPGNTSPRTVVQLAETWWWRNAPATEFGPASITWQVDPSAPLFVRASAPGFAEVRRAVTPEEAAAGRIVVRILRGFPVRCRLTGPDVAVAGAGAVLVGEPAAEGAGRSRVEPARRHDDGTLEFDSVAPGRWTLVVRWPDDLVAVERPADVASAANLGDVAIPAAATLRGTVTLPDGRPAGGAEIRLHADGARGGDAWGRVRSDGTFAIAAPRGMRSTLVVSRPGWGTAVARIDDPAAPLRLRLAPEGRLEVRIRLPAVVGSAWSWRVRTPDGAAEWQAAHDEPAEVAPGFDHVVVFRGLAPGPIVAVAESTTWRLEAPATIVSGETATVVLDGRR
jgi:hypothetical protein